MLELNIKELGSLRKRFTKLFIHPAAEAIAPLAGKRFDVFCRVRQQFPESEIDPVYAVRVPEPDGHFNGSIAAISGRTELEACRKQGREPKIVLYEGPQSPSELSAVLNLLHNHPTTCQRAAIAAEYADRFAQEAKERQKAAGGYRKPLLSKLTKAIDATTCKTSSPPAGDAGSPAPIHARELAAEYAEVSSGYVWQAQKIRAESPDLFQKVKAGEYTLVKANSEIRNAAKRQRNAAAAGGELEKPRDTKSLSGIRTGDCLKILPTLPRRKSRLLFADPPYNIGVNYGNGIKADRLPDAVYLAMHERWIGMLPELLTPDGAAWVLIDNKYAAEFCMMLKRTGMMMRAWIKWYEAFGNNQPNNFNRTSRHLFYFVRDPKNFVFDPKVFNRPSARQLHYGDKRANERGKIWDDVWGIEENNGAIPRLSGTCAERIPDFPTQLPLALLSPIVRGCSEEGDLIIDPFSGSGTTAAACAIAGRECLGIEINPTYADLSRKRLAGIKQERPKQ